MRTFDQPETDYCLEPGSQYVSHIPQDNIVYVITNQTTVHGDAIEECRALGGYLAMPKTAAQVESLQLMIRNRTLGEFDVKKLLQTPAHVYENKFQCQCCFLSNQLQ